MVGVFLADVVYYSVVLGLASNLLSKTDKSICSKLKKGVEPEKTEVARPWRRENSSNFYS